MYNIHVEGGGSDITRNAPSSEIHQVKEVAREIDSKEVYTQYYVKEKQIIKTPDSIFLSESNVHTCSIYVHIV